MPRKYEVKIELNDDGEYVIKSDTYLFTFVQKIAEDYLKPIVSKSMEDKRYRLIISGAGNQGYLGFSTNTRIPITEDDLYEVLDWKSIAFHIIIPKSESDDSIAQIIESIESNLAKSRYDMTGYILVTDDESFEKFMQADDPYHMFKDQRLSYKLLSLESIEPD